MPIALTCPNGHRLQVKDEFAGKKAKCPKCGAMMMVPAPPVASTAPPGPPVASAVPETPPVTPSVPPAPRVEVTTGPSAPPDDPGYEVVDDAQPDTAALESADYSVAAHDAASATTPSPASDDVDESSPIPAHAPRASKQKRSAEPTGWTTTYHGPLVAGVSAAACFSLVVIAGLLFLRSGAKTELAEAGPSMQPALDVAASASAPSTAAQPPATQSPAASTAPPPTDGPAATPPTEPKPAEPRGEFDLNHIPQYEKQAEVFELAGKTDACAYDDDSGRLAIGNEKIGFVVYSVEDLLARKPAPVGTIPMKSGVVTICSKPLGARRVFVVSARGENKIRVIDPGSLEPVGEIDLPEKTFAGSICGSQDPKDPFVYYVPYQETDPDSDPKRNHKSLGQIGRINLVTMQLAGMAQDPNQASINSCTAIDGGWIFYASTDGSATGTWPESGGGDEIVKLNFVPARHSSSNSGRNYRLPIAPHGQLVGTRDRTGWHDVLSTPIGYGVHAYFRTLPFVIGLKSEAIVIGSANDFRELASLSVVMFARSGPSESYSPRFSAVEPDDKRRLAIVVGEQRMTIVSLAGLNLPNERAMAMRGRPPFFVTVGQEVTVDLEDDAPGVPIFVTPAKSAADRTGINLIKSLEGADIDDASAAPDRPRVEGHRFRWTPSPKQVGLASARLWRQDGNRVHVWYFDFNVRYPTIDVPFYATGAEIAASRDKAVVWGTSFPDSKETKNYLGVVDLAKRQFLRHREIDWPVYSVAVTDQHVFTEQDNCSDPRHPSTRNIQNPTKFLQWRLDDLNGIKRIDLSSHGELHVIANRYLTVSMPFLPIPRYSLPDLNPIEPALPKYLYHETANPVGDGWLWEGILWDHELRKPQLLVFPVLFGMRPERPTGMKDGVDAGDGIILTHPSGANLFQWTRQDVEYTKGHTLLEHPSTLSVHVTREGNASLEILSRTHAASRSDRVSLNQGGTFFPLVMNRLPPRESRPNSKPPPPGFVSSGGGQIVVAVGGRVYFFPISQLPLPNKRPFQFDERQSTFVLNGAAKSTKVKYSAPDAVRYELRVVDQTERGPFFEKNEPKKKALESKDGEFDLSLGTLEQIAAEAASLIVGPYHDSKVNPQEKLAKYLKDLTPAFRELAGKAPGGVPYPVCVTVVATRQDGARAGMAHWYLVDVPRNAVQKALIDK